MTRQEPTAVPGARQAAESWTVGTATPRDVPGVARGIRRLLDELGAATPPAETALVDAIDATVGDPTAGIVLVARTAADAIVGVLGASFGRAIHHAGRYAVIEELWVDPAWRGHAVGRALIATLVDDVLPRERIACVEVGLPRPSFAGLEATAGFYLACGFSPVGPRMRRVTG